MQTLGMQVFTDATAGMFLWARFPQIEDSAELSNLACKKAVILAPGAVFRQNLERSAWMRFNISVFETPLLQEFLRSVN